jgi:hypothetical protein
MISASAAAGSFAVALFQLVVLIVKKLPVYLTVDTRKICNRRVVLVLQVKRPLTDMMACLQKVWLLLVACLS